MKKITEEQFTQAMTDAVAERGEDYVYETIDGICRYSDREGNPSCLIGLALHLIDPDIVPSFDITYNAPAILADFDVPDNVANAAYVAQWAQDMKNTWGDALSTYLGDLEKSSSHDSNSSDS